MTPAERMEVLRVSGSKDFISGKKRPPFPETVDNTMRSSFRKCERTFFYEHLLCRVMGSDNIHLVAGRAFAEAMDVFRKSYYTPKTEDFRNLEAALDKGIVALIETYGYDEARENDPEWAANPKSCERMVAAFLSYWKFFSPKTEPGKLLIRDGKPTTEFAGTFPLEVLHPETGEPLRYSFRFDFLESRGGSNWLCDDKTTTSLGVSWSRQWELRSQFLGYTYASREVVGIPVVGCIARGTGILKTSIKHMEVPIYFPPFLVERWWVQVNKDYQKMVDKWASGDWDYDMADGCAAYGGCKFVDACRSKFPHNALNNMPIRVWNPEHPEQSPVMAIEEI